MRSIVFLLLLILFGCTKDSPEENSADRIYSEWENYYELWNYDTYFYINSLVPNTYNHEVLLSAFIRRNHFAYDCTYVFRLVHDNINPIDTAVFFEGFQTYVWKNKLSEKYIKMNDRFMFLYDKNENICCNWHITDLNKKHKSSKCQVDFSSNIWLASNTRDAKDDGLQMFDGKKWITYFEGTTFWGLCFDMSGNLYASIAPDFGESGIVMKYDYNKWDTILVCSGIDEWIPCMHFDQENNLWCGVLYRFVVGPEYGDGLYIYNGDSITRYNIYNSELPSNSVVEIEIDNENNKWIGMYTGSLAKLSPDGTWKIFNKENTPLTFESIEHIAVDGENNVWMAVQFQGLARMKE